MMDRMNVAVNKGRSTEISGGGPELLAPAGDWDAMKAAVANGADAVYFGLDNFNARHRAANFTVEELPKIMTYLHDHNVKGFLTFNTLIFSDELPAAVSYINAIAAAGVDAVIVQDLGLTKLIARMAPTLAIHGSTQMTLTEPRGIEFVREMGIRRVVLARELGIEDIRRIVGATVMPLEIFVHGALCVAYSGQCLTSEALGGRSANRGQCAQACRLPYELMVDGNAKDLGDKSYLLSPQDLAAYELIGDLTEAGAASFKIEGRLKSAHYVAATTQTYRQAIDSATKKQNFQIVPQQRADLEQTFSRGFTHGFLSGVNHQKLVAARFPKSRGLKIGTVAQVLPRSIVIQSAANVQLRAGDGVVFDEGHPEQDEQGGRVFAVRPRGKQQLEIELGHGDVNLSAIAPGALVWKTDDPVLRKRLEHSFSRDLVARRIGVDVHVQAHVGQKLTLTFKTSEQSAAASWDKPLEKAQKFPLTEEMLREQIGRMGDTPFELRSLEVETSGGPMVPKSVLNELRRDATARLMQARATRQVHEVTSREALEELRREVKAGGKADQASAMYVLVRTLEQLDAVLAWRGSITVPMVYCDFEDVRRYAQAVERCWGARVPIALATLRVIKPSEEGLLRQILDFAPDAVLVRNLAAVSFYRQFAPDLPQIGDYSLNIANELTAKIFADAGLIRMVPSYDLNWRQMNAMLSRFDANRFEAVVHQHMPMFHMEHCVFAHTLSNGKDFHDCGRPCERHSVDLRDRTGLDHPLIPDVGCRNTVFNGQAQSAAEFVPEMLRMGLRNFRVELLREKAEEVGPLLDRYAEVLKGKMEPMAALRSLKVLNQLGVTRGTLDRE
jgi:putative protease